LKKIAELVDQNPLGSAAGYGSSLPNDRVYSTELLDFQGLLVNSIYAQTSRGKAEIMMAFAMSNIAITLNRFANDICIYSNENYQFLKLPVAFTTGSSIMPHKKNPDVMELTRAKCNQLLALPGRLQLLMTNMQTGYHRDYQLLKEILFPEIDRLHQVLDIVSHCIPEIMEKQDILSDEKYALCYTVENINALVKSGTAFRDAYHQVKQAVNDGTYVPLKEIDHTHLGSVGNLGLEQIRSKFEE
jgi:argininosuccinate lyase